MTVPQELTLITNPCGCEVRYTAGAEGTEYRIAYCGLHNAGGRILSQLRRTTELWPERFMFDHLSGAKTFAIALLTDADTTSTEAEQLVDSALAQSQEPKTP